MLTEPLTVRSCQVGTSPDKLLLQIEGLFLLLVVVVRGLYYTDSKYVYLYDSKKGFYL